MFTPPTLPEGVNCEELLDHLRKLSWSAADILMAYARGDKPPYGLPQALNVKETNDGPVTMADLAVNDLLLKVLSGLYPKVEWELLSEESAKDNSVQKSSIASEWIWILDPLDGTKDFIEGNGEYAVHLALVKGHEPVLGVILIPELDEIWFGVLGIGSWCEDRSGSKTFVQLSERENIKDLVLVTSRNHRDSRFEELLKNLEVASKKTTGSVGCKVAKILRGESDLYISLSGNSAPKDWDMAAPEIVLRAAGGEFTHVDGKSLRYNKGDFFQRGCLIATNGRNHKSICQHIGKLLSNIDLDSTPLK